MDIWTIQQPVEDVGYLPKGRLGEIVGITLERSFLPSEVDEAAAHLVSVGWEGSASTKAEVIVAAQAAGYGSQNPKLETMRPSREASSLLIDAMDRAAGRLTASRRELAGIQTLDDHAIVQAKITAAQTELDQAMAAVKQHQQQTLERLEAVKAQLPASVRDLI